MAPTVDQARNDRQRALELVLRGLAPALRGGAAAPALAALWARADALAAPIDADAAVRAAFGLGTGAPEAPYVRLGAGAAPDGAYRLRARPVTLIADLDRVHLVEAGEPPDPAAAAALAATLAPHLATAGYVLEPGPAWTVRAPRPLAVETRAPAHAAHAGLRAAMPAGADARELARLMTELQMLLHEHPVNRAREAAGRPPLNGVWLWGGGVDAPSPPRAPPAVEGDDALLRGLARAAGIAHDGVGMHGLACLDLAGDAARLAALDARLASALAGLRAGGTDVITIHVVGVGSRRLTRRGWWRFWRRPADLATFGEPR